MKELWRIPFTLLTVGLILLGGYMLGLLAGLLLYLWVGFLIMFFLLAESFFPKCIIAWLPAIWSEKVLEWTIR